MMFLCGGFVVLLCCVVIVVRFVCLFWWWCVCVVGVCDLGCCVVCVCGG